MSAETIPAEGVNVVTAGYLSLAMDLETRGKILRNMHGNSLIYGERHAEEDRNAATALRSAAALVQQLLADRTNRPASDSAPAEGEDHATFLRKWAKDIRSSSGQSVDADRLDAIAECLGPVPGVPAEGDAVANSDAAPHYERMIREEIRLVRDPITHNNLMYLLGELLLAGEAAHKQAAEKVAEAGKVQEEWRQRANAAIAEAEAERVEVGELLAVIHRDGGQYEELAGRSRAISDAIAVVVCERTAADASDTHLAQALDALRVAVEALKRIATEYPFTGAASVAERALTTQTKAQVGTALPVQDGGAE